MEKWHRIKFRIKWNRKSPANFFIDLIIIDLLIAPTVEKFKSGLLWTFHRSADAEDKDGHMLKFAFYTDSEKANEIIDYVKSNENFNLIEKYLENIEIEHMEAGIEVISGGIKASPEILKSWPYYIMGVCEMYMSLIEETKKKKPNGVDKDNSEQLEKYYREIEEDIAKQFYEGGQHAFFHHLWAIFGYRLMKLILKAGRIQQGVTDKGERVFAISDIFGI